jgi:sugar phosphate isomerase/epimerase
MKDIELIASYWTLAGGALPHTDKEYSTFEFKERVEAAARVGFKGIGLWHADIEHVRKRYTFSEMRRILDDNGMKYIELEFLADFFCEPGERRAAAEQRKELLFEACEALGGRHVKVGNFIRTPVAMPRLIDEFGKLCEEAAARGIQRIGFEMIPQSAIESIEQARQLVEGAAQKNGGIIFDLWHIVKLGIPYDAVMQFPKQYFVALEINDGYLQAPPGMDFVTEVTAHRKFCGYGEFDVKGFVARLPGSSYSGPVGIEVLSQELRSWPLEKAVTTAYNTTLAQFPR